MSKRTGTKAQILLLSVAILAFGVIGAHAQDYPASVIQMVVPYGAGGTTDIFYRTISDALGKNIGGTISVINKRGAGGVVGTSSVVNSKPDGYTLVNISPENTIIAEAFHPNLPYDYKKDFTYLAKMCFVAVGLAVRSDSPLKTFEDLEAYAKANPWKLKAGGMGISGTPHMIIGVFSRDAKLEITYVPFDGGGEVAANLLGGHIDVAPLSITSISSHLASGKMRLLATCTPKRLANYPDVPTLGEKGYPNSSFSVNLGLGAPKGLPPEIAGKLTAAVEKTLKDPNVMAAIEKIEGVVIDFKSGEDYYAELIDKADIFKQIAATTDTKK
jgi:tripartite-type tricarboxylate transporter receptor subunit TctC